MRSLYLFPRVTQRLARVRGPKQRYLGYRKHGERLLRKQFYRLDEP
jgi:hypothetical protein